MTKRDDRLGELTTLAAAVVFATLLTGLAWLETRPSEPTLTADPAPASPARQPDRDLPLPTPGHALVEVEPAGAPQSAQARAGDASAPQGAPAPQGAAGGAPCAPRVLTDDDVGAMASRLGWGPRSGTAARVVAGLGVPLDAQRFEDAVEAARAWVPDGCCARLHVEAIIGGYGPRDIWQAATTTEQRRAIMATTLDPDELCELWDMPTSVLDEWAAE